MKKLYGYDALNRTNNLMESLTPSKSKTDFSKIESTHLAFNGKIYAIIKENAGYILKVGNKSNPSTISDFDFIGGEVNKSKNVRQTYNESLRTLNLMDIEFKRIYGDKLIKECYSKLDEKTVLKVKAPKEVQPTQSNDFDTTSNDDFGSSSDFPTGDSENSDFDTGDNSNSTSENPDDYADVNPDDLGTDDPEKMIQKLAGKLAYELREFDDSDKYSNSAKFAMSMTTSALQTDKMSDSDKQSIEKKITAKFDESSDNANNDGQDDFGDTNDDFDTSNSEDFNNNDNNSNKQESFKTTKSKLLESLKSIKYNLNESLFSEDDDLYIDGIDNIYDVPEDKILFDIEEDVYNEPVKTPKNKKYQTSLGNIHIGRIDGDDDSPSIPSEKWKSLDGIMMRPNLQTNTKRNPFKYVK